MRFSEALAELDARQPERMVPDLSRITALAELLDDPQLTYPTLHITGTNGKTTTARVVTSLACAHGLTAGLYTSPHLLSVRERIALCGVPISEEEFTETYEHLLPFLRTVDGRGKRVTYFETLTALSFLWFSDKPVSLGVFEVGMGGAWDATNLVAGDVAVLCPIALDHPELGSTVLEVATEKAGIIKPGKVVVAREQPPDALGVIRDRCREYEARLVLEGPDFGIEERRQAVGGQQLLVRGTEASYDDLFVPLVGEHAARNAGAAVVALEAFLERPLSADAVREGLAAASSPGRLEIVGRHPLVVLDGAHNPAGAAALAGALREAFTWERLHLVIAVSANKDIPGIAAALAPLAARAYATRNSSERSAPADQVGRAMAAAGTPTETFGSVEEALVAAGASAGARDLILVTGSLYTVADARRTSEGS
ncbi:MAG TPA: folylpolyglutamate synthase/dihydrofolate synthase family protein [Actinomycetota bacterium]|jgi:dihydrofolate synthase/folylpolyglutamate synthase|nr:folylpolyglutamate synthase/dihydrofolate synthase family protein [Actinomycetota bacterium]